MYQDFAHDEASAGVSASKHTSATFSKRPQTFPIKLHIILKELEADGTVELARWAPHGRCFFIDDRKQFVDKVLHRWFDMSKFTSFQRQLSIYGFKRISRGKDKGGFYHELFLRTKPSLANHIPRTQIKGKRLVWPRDHAVDPDFYSMAPLPLTSSLVDVKETAASVGGTQQQAHVADILNATSDTFFAAGVQQPTSVMPLDSRPREVPSVLFSLPVAQAPSVANSVIGMNLSYPTLMHDPARASYEAVGASQLALMPFQYSPDSLLETTSLLAAIPSLNPSTIPWASPHGDIVNQTLASLHMPISSNLALPPTCVEQRAQALLLRQQLLLALLNNNIH